LSTALIGKKIGMTRVYDDKGVIVPVTVIQAGPCTVVQVKTDETDGYSALRIGFGEIKPSRQKKPQSVEAEKAKIAQKRYIREIRLESASDKEVGQELTVTEFAELNYVDVTGISKGHGFAGGMKRHGFKGLEASHGVERKHRSLGSVGGTGGSAGTSRGIRKGKKMAGHEGHSRRTSKNHRVVGIDTENNLIMVKGSVAGPRNGLVMVIQAKTKA